jgi:hypothetical protein
MNSGQMAERIGALELRTRYLRAAIRRAELAHRLDVAKARRRALPSEQAGVSCQKAGEILRHGEVRGHALTEAQRGMFGAIRGTGPRRRRRARKSWDDDAVIKAAGRRGGWGGAGECTWRTIGGRPVCIKPLHAHPERTIPGPGPRMAGSAASRELDAVDAQVRYMATIDEQARRPELRDDPAFQQRRQKEHDDVTAAYAALDPAGRGRVSRSLAARANVESAARRGVTPDDPTRAFRAADPAQVAAGARAAPVPGTFGVTSEEHERRSGPLRRQREAFAAQTRYMRMIDEQARRPELAADPRFQARRQKEHARVEAAYAAMTPQERGRVSQELAERAHAESAARLARRGLTPAGQPMTPSKPPRRRRRVSRIAGWLPP